LCDSGCDVNLLPVHFVNLENVLPRASNLLAAGGTPIEVIGQCRIPMQLENGFIFDKDFIISPSIKEPMLGIDWLTRNEARWNFLDGTIMIRNPESNIRRVNPPPTQTGQKLSVRSIYTQRNVCIRLTTGSVVLSNFTCTIPKEVLFQVLDKLCNTAKTNFVIKQLLDDFVNKLIAGRSRAKVRQQIMLQNRVTFSRCS